MRAIDPTGEYTIESNAISIKDTEVQLCGIEMLNAIAGVNRKEVVDAINAVTGLGIAYEEEELDPDTLQNNAGLPVDDFQGIPQRDGSIADQNGSNGPIAGQGSNAKANGSGLPNVLVTKSEQSIEALVKEYLAVTGMADLQGKERPFTEVARDVAALSTIDKKVFDAIYTATAFSGSNKDFLGMQEIASKVLADRLQAEGE